MDFLQTLFTALPLLEGSIHIGSDGPAKGRAIGPSRDFAAVLVQTPARVRVLSILPAYSIK
jgi:hypothetical protein